MVATVDSQRMTKGLGRDNHGLLRQSKMPSLPKKENALNFGGKSDYSDSWIFKSVGFTVIHP